MLIENSLNSGELSKETILSQVTKVKGATTIPNGSTLKREEAVSIFRSDPKMMIWSDLVGDSKQSALQTGEELATLTEHNWVTLPLRSTCPLDLEQQQSAQTLLLSVSSSLDTTKTLRCHPLQSQRDIWCPMVEIPYGKTLLIAGTSSNKIGQSAAKTFGSNECKVQRPEHCARTVKRLETESILAGNAEDGDMVFSALNGKGAAVHKRTGRELANPVENMASRLAN